MNDTVSTPLQCMQDQRECFLGIDLGSSFLKLSLIDSQGFLIKSLCLPQNEFPIISEQQDFCEQNPEVWWEQIVKGIKVLQFPVSYNVVGIGVAYQMHGLIALDQDKHLLRKCIIWSDTRTNAIAERLKQTYLNFELHKQALCFPGNLTLSKLIWIKENEKDLFQKIRYLLLPGDYIAMKLTGQIYTTYSGLSQATLWNFQKQSILQEALKILGIDRSILPDALPNFGQQGQILNQLCLQLHFNTKCSLFYRSGDQPNNCFALGVQDIGQIAATAGSSGVLYTLIDYCQQDNYSDVIEKLNFILHNNYRTSKKSQQIGKLLCINGCGTAYNWLRKTFFSTLSYQQLNFIGSSASSKGLIFLPFGNGTERIFPSNEVPCSLTGINFNVHQVGNIVRAWIQGIAFNFVYAIQLILNEGKESRIIKTGNDNMFQCQLFSKLVAVASKYDIDVIEMTGSVGSAEASRMVWHASQAKPYFRKYGTIIKKFRVQDYSQKQITKINEDYLKWKNELYKVMNKKCLPVFK